MLNSPLGGRRGIGFGLGRSWQRESADWWLSGGISAANCVAAYQPIGAASYAASKVNLANPGTYDATEGTAPTWDATNGWQFDGINDYLITGIAPANDQSWSMIISHTNYSRNSYRFLAGCYYNGSPYDGFAISFYWAKDAMQYFSGGTVQVANNLSSGVSAIAGNKAYRNGVDEGLTIPDNAVHNFTNIYVGAVLQLNVPQVYYFGKSDIYALSVYNVALTQTQVQAVGTAIAAL